MGASVAETKRRPIRGRRSSGPSGQRAPARRPRPATARPEPQREGRNVRRSVGGEAEPEADGVEQRRRGHEAEAVGEARARPPASRRHGPGRGRPRRRRPAPSRRPPAGRRRASAGRSPRPTARCRARRRAGRAPRRRGRRPPPSWRGRRGHEHLSPAADPRRDQADGDHGEHMIEPLSGCRKPCDRPAPRLPGMREGGRRHQERPEGRAAGSGRETDFMRADIPAGENYGGHAPQERGRRGGRLRSEVGRPAGGDHQHLAVPKVRAAARRISSWVTAATRSLRRRDVVDAEALEGDLHELVGDLGRGVEAERVGAGEVVLGLLQLLVARAVGDQAARSRRRSRPGTRPRARSWSPCSPRSSRRRR